MYYEINIARNGRHFFATAERSITTEDKAREVYAHIKDRFTERDGFSVTVTQWQNTGVPVTSDFDK